MGISLAYSGLLASPPTSCDRIDDDHMTTVGGRILGRVKAFGNFSLSASV